MKKHLLSFVLLLIITQTKAQKPVANFSASSDTICANDCISFADSSSNNPTSWLWTFAGAVPQSSTDQNPYVCYLDSGNFDVELVVANFYGSDSISKSNLIFVYPAPTTPNITQSRDTLFCSTDPSYISYQWYDTSTAIPGATLPYFIMDTCAFWNVQVTDSNGCKVAVSIPIIVLRSDTFNGPCGLGGIHESSVNSFNIYPDPATNQLTIHSSLFQNEQATVSIMNVLGQTSPPAPLHLERGDALIDVSKLAAGMYFLQLKTESGSVVKRFVKE